MRIAIPNKKFEIVTLRVPVRLDPSSGRELGKTDMTGMPVQSLGMANGFEPTPATLPPKPPEPPQEPPKEGHAASILVQQAKLSGDMTVSQDALQFLQVERRAELAVLSDNVKHAATRLGQEAVIYGAMEAEKWLRINQECRVTYLYLDLRWEFSLCQGCIPQLERIGRTSC